jgi:leucyl-tRNA synthetase
VQNKVQIIVQVNGKLRAKLIIAADTSKAQVEAQAITVLNRCLRSISSVIFLSVWWVFKRTSVWMSLRLLKEPTGLFAWSFIKPLTKR